MSVDILTVLFYARRDIFKNKKIFIFITLSIIFATANIIAVNGLMDGMIYDFVDNTVESSIGHLNIYPDDNERFIEGIRLKEQMLDRLNEVEGYSPRLVANGVLSHKQLSAPILILALDPEKERKVTGLLQKLDRGTAVNIADKNAILVSYRLSEDLKFDIGDEAEIAFENGVVKVYYVKGIIRTGDKDFDSSTVIMSVIEADRELGIDNSASVILVKLSDKGMAGRFKPVLIRELEVNNVRTWEEETGFLLSFADAWKSFTAIISSVGLIAAAISVGVVIYINVLHKKRQIGIMKAIGAKDSFIFAVFITEAALFGVIGVSIGNVVGYFVTRYLEAHPFYDAIMQTWISARFGYYLFYNATLISFSVTLLAGVYPAIKASRVDIIKAIWGR